MSSILKRKQWLLLLMVLVVSGITACKKEAGTGGNSTVYGKVFVKDYNSTFTVLQDSYYGPGVWVYIMYGDDRDYGDRIQTAYDGTYEFKYLRPGNYRIYAYSKDSTMQTNADVAVIRNVEISGNKQEIQLSDIVIFK